MRSTTFARLVIALLALAVAASLIGVEHRVDRCDDAARRAFLANRAPAPELGAHVDAVVHECSGSEPLTHIAVGLRIERPRAAARLAREAARREPDSYTAWAVLAIAAPAIEARPAARRAAALNPLSAAGGP